MARQQEPIAADWASRGFSCDLWTDPPGQRWEDFTHATDEVVTVLDGDMEFEVGEQIHHPQPGEELLIPAGAVHSARNVGTAITHWLDGDGRDEIAAGYAMLNPDGSTRWVFQSQKVDQRRGHCDCFRLVRAGKTPAEFRFAMTLCGANALAFLDGTGRSLWELTGEHFEQCSEAAHPVTIHAGPLAP